MKLWLLPAVLALGACSHTPALPEYAVQRAAAAPRIDGRLDDAAWRQAAQLSLLFPWDSQTGDKQATRVRLLWDEQFLYLAYECEDRDITARHTRRDDPTYEDDAVELFIGVGADPNTYVGLEINARAVLYDYRKGFPHGLDKSLDLHGVVLAAQADGSLNDASDRDRGWVLELAIPLSNFGVRAPQAGTRWRANLNRWDGTEPHRRLSMWSGSGLAQPDPHAPQRFGTLRFMP